MNYMSKGLASSKLVNIFYLLLTIGKFKFRTRNSVSKHFWHGPSLYITVLGLIVLNWSFHHRTFSMVSISVFQSSICHHSVKTVY